MYQDSFIETFISGSAHPDLVGKLKPYEGLIGAWEFDWVGHKEDGSTWTVPGEWHFSWILEGRAIQDTWICPGPDLRGTGEYPKGEYGTTIRYYDFTNECIKVIWLGPILSMLKIFEVKQLEDQVIQNEIVIGDAKEISRWFFKNIKDNSFTWESPISSDGGKTWRTDQEVFARRKA